MSGSEHGKQITIIGGSSLFHGAPILALKTTSRFVDMVFFATPEKSVGHVAEQIKSKLSSFIWIPWEETPEYIEKSDVVLIGPGFMRYQKESTPHGYDEHFCDEACHRTRKITEEFLNEFKNKKWVIDAGSLQVMDTEWIPKGSILTPNKKEYEGLFGDSDPADTSKKYNCTIILKGRETEVASPKEKVTVKGGNDGLTKGGTGDVHAGLCAALFAEHSAFDAAKLSSQYIKDAADELYKKVGENYNSDDLAEIIPQIAKDR